MKILIRLGGCPGWYESLLGAQAILLVLSCCGSNIKSSKYTKKLKFWIFQMAGKTVAIEMKDTADVNSDQHSDYADLLGYNRYERTINTLQQSSSELWKRNNILIKKISGVVLILLYFTYFGYALYYRFVLFSMFCRTVLLTVLFEQFFPHNIYKQNCKKKKKKYVP